MHVQVSRGELYDLQLVPPLPPVHLCKIQFSCACRALPVQHTQPETHTTGIQWRRLLPAEFSIFSEYNTHTHTHTHYILHYTHTHTLHFTLHTHTHTHTHTQSCYCDTSFERAHVLHSGLKSSGSDEGTTPRCVRAAFAAPVNTTGASSRMGKCELVK